MDLDPSTVKDIRRKVTAMKKRTSELKDIQTTCIVDGSLINPNSLFLPESLEEELRGRIISRKQLKKIHHIMYLVGEKFVRPIFTAKFFILEDQYKRDINKLKNWYKNGGKEFLRNHED